MSSSHPSSLLLAFFVISMLVAAGIAYGFSKTDALSVSQIIAVSSGVGLFLMIYGVTTHRWYLHRSQHRTNQEVMRQRTRLILIVLITAIAVLALSGGVQTPSQIIGLLLLLGAVGILWVLLQWPFS